MRRKKAFLVGSIIIVVLIAAMIIRKQFSSSETVSGKAYSASDFIEETYLSYLEEHNYTGTLSQDTVSVDLRQYTASETMEATVEADGVATGDDGRITWEFTVSHAGFYNMRLGYIPISGTNSDIQRILYIDGKCPYDSLKQVVLKRSYEDEKISVKENNEIRPQATEVFRESVVYIEDYNRRGTDPFVFYLSEGAHTVSFEVIKEPMKYTEITFTAKEKPLSYAEAKAAVEQKAQPYTGEAVVAQAERAEGATVSVIKSSTTINIQKNYSDSEIVPYHPYHIIYNTIGKDSFSMPGDYITWTVTVPESALYELSFKGKQGSNRDITSYRRLLINGRVPYEEMNAIAFTYSSNMKHYTISDEQGTPYLFYLEAGENEITLEVVLGAFGEVLTQVEESMYQLNQLYLRVIQLTGVVPDIYIDYEVTKKIPEFAEIMARESERLSAACEACIGITGEKGEYTALLEKMALEAKNLAADPESVVKELVQLKNNISALGTWVVTISKMPLELDSLVLAGTDSELPKDKDGFFTGIYYGIVRFFSTFFIDQNELSKGTENREETEPAGEDYENITVWMVSSGKEQAQILQNMIDETFTPKYNIRVNLQLIPLDVVLRAALSGRAPDVLVGLSQGTLGDFAMRNALLDLSKLEGFEEEASRYCESAVRAASYQDGVYGLAEQQTFMMLFYRKDILEKLGAEIPQTWQDVKELIPVLQMHNYDFYLPTSGFYPSVLFQYGGDLYLGEGNDYGMASALASEEAMQAFKDFTDFFTSYKLLVSVDFQNRFRTGEIPIGITNYTTYNTLEIFAPEIKGLWGFAPIPGVEGEDHTVNRSYLSDTVQSVIMKGSKHQEASWEFLKWWTGSETQLQYANTIESVMGSAARYAAADVSVLSSLPWTNAEVNALRSQMEACIGLPAIPGNYMTTRMITYAFDSVVAESKNPREALYLNIRTIDKELLKKRAEFHLSEE